MSNFMHGFHHLRARLNDSGMEPFPARTPLKRYFDFLMYGVGVAAPLSLVPQIIQLYSTQSSVGLALPTWVLFATFNVLWAAYGAVHKEFHIVCASSLMALFDAVIVVGILMY